MLTPGPAAAAATADGEVEGADTNDELRVTLAWTDPPAMLPSAGPTLVNDLDLQVLLVKDDDDTADASLPLTLEGNSWAPRDRRNNIERVVVRAATRTRRRVDGDTTEKSGAHGSGSDDKIVIARKPRQYKVVITGHSVRWVPADDPRGQPYSLVATGPGLVRCGSTTAQVQVEQQQRDETENDDQGGEVEGEVNEDDGEAPPVSIAPRPRPGSYIKPSPSPSASPASAAAPPGGDASSSTRAPHAEAEAPQPADRSPRQCRWWEYVNPNCW